MRRDGISEETSDRCTREYFLPLVQPGWSNQVGSNFSNHVALTQAVNLFGVVAKFAEPRVRMLGKGRGGPSRRRLVLGKKKTPAGYFLFSGGSFKLGDEV